MRRQSEVWRSHTYSIPSRILMRALRTGGAPRRGGCATADLETRHRPDGVEGRSGADPIGARRPGQVGDASLQHFMRSENGGFFA